MAGRNSQIARIYCILDILEGAPQGLSAAEITERVHDRGHEVGKRTVYRDLQALNAAGFPLHERGQTEVNGTRWAMEKTTRITDYLALSTRELVALYLSRSALQPLKDTPFFKDLEQALHKIEEKLGKKSQDYLESLESEFRFEAAPRWGLGLDSTIVETLRAGCAERQVLSVDYHSTHSGKSGPRKIGPQYLYFAKGSLYLVGEDLADGVIKIFAIPRIKAASMTNEAYEKEPVSPEEHFANSFGIFRGKDPVVVRLRVEQPLASFLKERQWHASQKVTDLEHSAIEMAFHLAVTPDFEQWVLGLGPKVKVLEPEGLQQAVADAAAAVVAHYRPK